MVSYWLTLEHHSETSTQTTSIWKVKVAKNKITPVKYLYSKYYSSKELHLLLNCPPLPKGPTPDISVPLLPHYHGPDPNCKF